MCSTVANYAGKTRTADAPAASAADFMPSLADLGGQRKSVESKPTLLADPVAQAKLIRKALFNKDE